MLTESRREKKKLQGQHTKKFNEEIGTNQLTEREVPKKYKHRKTDNKEKKNMTLKRVHKSKGKAAWKECG
jgi:hypothetical protein